MQKWLSLNIIGSKFHAAFADVKLAAKKLTAWSNSFSDKRTNCQPNGQRKIAVTQNAVLKCLYAEWA